MLHTLPPITLDVGCGITRLSDFPVALGACFCPILFAYLYLCLLSQHCLSWAMVCWKGFNFLFFVEELIATEFALQQFSEENWDSDFLAILTLLGLWQLLRWIKCLFLKGILMNLWGAGAECYDLL